MSNIILSSTILSDKLSLSYDMKQHSAPIYNELLKKFAEISFFDNNIVIRPLSRHYVEKMDFSIYIVIVFILM